MRPAPPDDFVTAESQHFNSAVNNLVQDQPNKYLQTQLTSTQNPQSHDELSSTDKSIAPSDSSTINYTEVPEQFERSTLWPVNIEDSTNVNLHTQDLITTTESLSTQENFEGSSGDRATTYEPIMTTMTIPRKSWDSTKAYTDWFVKKMEKPVITKDAQFNKTGEEIIDDETHPKNHRSEWSEVRYPSDRSVYGYGRSDKLSPTTQLPGIVTKSVGDTSVKTLSDYVQAIFDTMKNADEERSIVDNAPNLWSDEGKTLTSTEAYNIPALSTVMGLGNDKYQLNNDNSSEQLINVTTQLPEVRENATVARYNIEEVTTLKDKTTSQATTSSSSIQPTPEAITTVEPVATAAKNTTSKLGAILRTSTTTKVSHMTEICYRGRCVMTKPRKDFRER